MLVLEAGRPDYPWDVFIHMPAALAFPIGSRFYDWKYESEPEPHMNGRRVYHARGKVLGGSSSINGMIFQRGNPLDYERWAADPGMETWDYAHCLPYFKRMENCLAAGADEFRGDDGPLVLERGPADEPAVRRVLRGGAAGRLPAHRRRERLPAGGLRAVRPQHPPRPPAVSAARAYLHPVMDRPNLTVRDPRAGDAASCSRAPARSASSTRARPRRGRRSRAGEVILCGGAINSPQLLQLSGVGDARRAARARHRRRRTTCRASASNLQDHLEVYIQHACTQPVSMQPYAGEVAKRPMVGAQWLSCAPGPGATNHFEGGGFVRRNDDVAYPNLMFHFLPIAVRYDGSPPAGGHGYQVHVGPMYSDARGSVKITSTDPRGKPALRFNYLSTEQDRREWVEAIRVARSILDQPAFAPFNGGEISPGPGGGDRRGDPRLGRAATPRPRCTRRARAGWAPTTMSVVDPIDDARARRRRPARGRRVGRCRTSPTATSTRR